jgi:hypothetical protein
MFGGAGRWIASSRFVSPELNLGKGLWLSLAVAVALLAAFAVWRFEGAGAGGAARARFAVGDDAFDFDRRYLGPGREDGVVELAVFFPGFLPAAGTGDVHSGTDVEDRFRRTLFIELRPADPQLDPAERTARLYLRFLSETAWSHPGGLIARAFEPGSPFAGDELFFAPPEGRQFAARCRRADASSTLPNTCIAAFRFDHVDAQVRFSASLLPDWEALMKGAQGLLQAARR